MNGVPREVPRPKPKVPQAPRVFGRGTFRGTPFTMIPPSRAATIGAKPNLYCKAIELVCGGSPKICVLIERKSWDRVKLEG